MKWMIVRVQRLSVKVIIYALVVFALSTLDSCRSTDTLFREPQLNKGTGDLKEDLLGTWKVENDISVSPLNTFQFELNNSGEFVMRVNDRPVQLTNLRVVGPLDFAISFKGLDYTELYLLGKFQSNEKNILLLINSDKENNTYETLQNIKLIKQ